MADENGIIFPPKSQSGYRKLYISRQLCAMLKALRKIKKPKSDEELVFGTESGRADSLGNLDNRCWKPIFEKAGVDWHRRYDYRHFHASDLVESGASLKRLKDELGHFSAAFTIDRYGHLFEGKDAEWKEKHEQRMAELRKSKA